MQQILKLKKTKTICDIKGKRLLFSKASPQQLDPRSTLAWRVRLCLTLVPIWESFACNAKVSTPSPQKTVLSLAGGASFISVLSLIFLFSSTHFLLPRHQATKNVLITKLSHELVNKFNK